MKHYIFTLLILTSFSCSKDEPKKPNTPPQAFEVTAKAEGTDVILTWTEAIDADGDAVTYAVVYGDTLSKGLTARTFTLKDLPYETDVSGTIVASDGKGGNTKSGFKVKTAPEPWDDRYVKIPDAEFEKFLIKEGIDDVFDGRLLKDKAISIEALNLDLFSKNLAGVNLPSLVDLSGLEAFVNLRYLKLYALSSLRYLDLTLNKKLELLEISQVSNLKELDLSQNSLLDRLDLHGVDELLGINLSKNRKLTYLKYTGGLSTINLSNNEMLRFLYIYESHLESMDLSKNLKLEELRLPANGLKKIELNSNIRLRVVDLRSNMLTSINVSTLKNLSELFLSSNRLTELNLCNNDALIF